jgi:hypothetical protein
VNDAEFLKGFTKWLMFGGIGCQEEHERLSAIAERIEWRPMETAPTNESVLIFVPNLEHYGPGIYRAMQVDMGTGRRWMTTAAGMGRDLGPTEQPTHWKPLDQPPASPAGN